MSTTTADDRRPAASIPSVVRFHAARAHLMAALDAMLTDPAVSDAARKDECDGTVSMIEQLRLLHGGKHA